MLGVKTVGNATLVAYDTDPVLVTDPWFGDEDDAYFGSWRLSHSIPSQEKSDILASPNVWFSHGHPDHLNGDSLKRFKNARILLPDHVGGRICEDLKNDGYNVAVLPDSQWVDLTSRVRIFCVPDYIQDATLLVEVGGRLFINMNDSGARARMDVVRRVAKNYKDVYLLRLSGYGDADMINIFSEDGVRLENKSTRKVGKWLSNYAVRVGANHVIPFSSFHQYQREDSAWANARTTPMAAYKEEFDEKAAEYIEPFSFIDCVSGQTSPLGAVELACGLRRPEEFGDVWSDDLDKDDVAVLKDYFARKHLVRNMLGFLRFKVGSQTHTIDLDGPAKRGITFEVPKNSLMTAVTYRVFDDLLIGNFMKTTLHDVESLYSPNFNFAVAKYGDNGGAETEEEVEEYLGEYKRRAGLAWTQHIFSQEAPKVFRRFVKSDSGVYSIARDVYNRMLRS